MINDLTTVANVKAWLSDGSGTGKSDVVIAQTITRVSAALLAWLSIPSFTKRVVTEQRLGVGGQQLMLKQFPVLSISSLIINNQTVVPGPPNTAGAQASNQLPGYYLDPWDGLPPASPQLLTMVGISLTRSAGYPNISVVYNAGYVYSADTQVIPSEATLAPASPLGLMVQDAGVVYANGTPLVAVASNPAVGQYIAPSPLAASPTSLYQFNAGDAGQTVTLSYSYVPAAIEGCACEWAAERLSYRTRIGQRSKSLGGQESVSFDISGIPKWVQVVLTQFRQVVPIG